MTWTYNLSLLATDPLMQVRAEIQDTDTNEQLLQDEEILYFISQEGSTYLAAGRAAEAIAAKFSREFDMSGGGLSERAGQLAENYRKLAIKIRGQASKFVAPYAGGISNTDKEGQRSDTDRVRPAFWVGMEENPGVPNPTDQDALLARRDGT